MQYSAFVASRICIKVSGIVIVLLFYYYYYLIIIAITICTSF